MEKFSRNLDDPCTTFLFFGTIRTFLGLALLEKVCFKEDLVGDIFGKLFKEGTSDRDGQREREKERFYYIFICSMRAIGIRESIKFINA